MNAERKTIAAPPWFRAFHPKLGICAIVVLALEAGLFCCDAFGLFPLPKSMSAFIAVAGTAVLLLSVLVCFLASLFLSWRFHIGTRPLYELLLVIVIPCGWLAFAIVHGEQQRKAVDALKRLGCQVEHEPNVTGDTPWGLSRMMDQPPAPLPQSFLVRLLGEDVFADLVYVDNTPFAGSEAIYVAFRDADTERLRGLKRLRHLTLNFDNSLFAVSGPKDGLSDAGMRHLRDLVQLRKLSLFNCRQITDAALKNVKGMSQLQRLCLHNAPHLTDAGLAELHDLRELRDLRLTSTSINGTGLKHLRRLTSLQELNLTESPVSDTGIEHIAQFDQLEELLLSHTHITSSGLQHVGKLPNLQILILDGTNVDDTGLVYLKNLTNLRILSLDGTKVTDAGLEHLKGLKQLEQLSLEGTEVTESGVRQLEELKKLRVLVLNETKVSDAAKRHLKTLDQFRLVDFDDQVFWMRME